MSKHTIARIENNLIFNGKYQLTAKEQKLVLFLISQVNPMAQFSFKPQVISTKDLGKLLLGKPRGSFYTEITDFISRLMTKRISFIVTAKMEGKVDALAGATITGDGVSAMIKSTLKSYVPVIKDFKTKA